MTPDYLHIDLLGPFATRIGGIAVEGYRSQKTKWVLGFLALQDGAEVEFDLLAETFWEEKRQSADCLVSSKALASVRQSVSNLVDIFGSDRIGKPGKSRVKINPVSMTVDALNFDTAVEEGSADALERAVSLYKGDLLAGCRDEWVQTWRVRHRAAYWQALKQLAEEATSRLDYASAEKYLRLLIASDAFKERHRTDLMILLMRRGEDHGAVQVFNEWRRQIANPKMGVGAEMQQLYDSIMARTARKNAGHSPHAPVRPSESPDLPYELPHPVSNLIGRDNCLEEVRGAISFNRLTMLQGPPGVGKTQVALHVANRMREEYSGGSLFLDLSGVSTEAALRQELANALQIFEPPACQMAAIAEHLRLKRFLLLLDNCEEISRKGTPVVRALLHACPYLTILGTSRNAWAQNIGEKTLTIEPLALPEASLLDLCPTDLAAHLPEYSAVALFVQSATNVQPDFALSSDNAHAVANLCRHLDGLPLALCIIASWAHTLSPVEMLQTVQTNQALSNSQSDGVPPRHRSLQTAIELSYGLLEPEAQKLFRRLSVFNGGWTPEAAEFVCSVPNVRKHLSSLQGRSLVFSQKCDRSRRFGFLQSLRQFARDRMTAEDVASSRWQHLGWFVTCAEEAAQGIAGSDQVIWLNRLERERANLNAALYEALRSGEDEKGLRLASALRMFWYIRGPNEEGTAWLRQFLSSFSTEATPLRASALNAAGSLAMQRADYDTAKVFFKERLDIERALGNMRGIANGLGNLGNIASLENDQTAAIEHFELSLAYFSQLDDKRGIALTLGNLATAALNQNRLGDAIKRHQEADPYLRELGDQHHLALSLANFAEVQCEVGDFAGATASLVESLSISRESCDQENLARCFYISFTLFVADGLMLEAAIVLGIAETMTKDSRIPVAPRAIPQIEQNRAILAESLIKDEFDEAFSFGERLSDEERVEQVRQLLKMRSQEPPMPPFFSSNEIDVT